MDLCNCHKGMETPIKEKDVWTEALNSDDKEEKACEQRTKKAGLKKSET